MLLSFFSAYILLLTYTEEDLVSNTVVPKPKEKESPFIIT